MILSQEIIDRLKRFAEICHMGHGETYEECYLRLIKFLRGKLDEEIAIYEKIVEQQKGEKSGETN